MKIRLLCFCAALVFAASISPDAQAAIYATDFYDAFGAGGVDIYDDNGTLIQDGFIYGLNTPTSIAFDTSGNLYVTSRFGGTIHAFDSNGSPLAGAPGAGGLYGDASANNAQFGGIAFAPNGDLYATDNGSNTIYVYDGSSTTASSTLTVPNGGAELGMPTFDSNGNLFVTSFNSHEVYKYDGNSFTTVVSAFAGGVFNPSGIAVADDGTIYVSGLGSNSLHVYDSAGTPITSIAVPFSPPPGTSFYPVSAPGGLAFDTNGDVLVAVLGAAAYTETPFPLGGILRYTPGGNSFTILTQDTGAYSGLALAPTAVPEPGGLLLLAMAGLSLAGWRFATRRRTND